MKKSITIVLCTGSLCLGYFAGAFITKRKMTAEKEKEIAEIRSIYINKTKEKETDTSEEKKEVKSEPENVTTHISENPDLKEAAMKILKDEAKTIIKEQGYSSDPDRGPLDDDEEFEEDESILEKMKKNEEKSMEVSYVISPSEFGEADYEEIELTYYADGVLAEDREIIDDPEFVVGPNALDSFGEYEEDTVYVRNDARRCDYVILKDFRNYSELPNRSRR